MQHPLKATRIAHNLTRKQLAEKLGIGATTIKRAETWKPIGAETRQRLCKFFNRSSEELGLIPSLEEQNQGKENMANATTLITAHSALAYYLEQQRQHLMFALAPGTTSLRVGDVIGPESLFIPPIWTENREHRGGDTSEPLATDPPTQTPHSLADHLINLVMQGNNPLLIGDAGQGKTTILKQLFLLMAERFLQGDSPLLPMYIPLREYSFSEDDSLWAHIEGELPLSHEEFVNLLRKQHIIFLFDGFDEIRGEVSQRSVNKRYNSRIFHHPSILSCRRSFYDFYLTQSPLQEHYPTRIELCPLSFNDSVAHYITAFCQHRRTTVSAEHIIATIKASAELQDLAQRPLLLLMILEIFTDPLEPEEQHWSTNKLYKKYSELWLKHEAAKPDSVLKWHEKIALLQQVAWLTAIRSSQHTTFTLEELRTFINSIATRHPGITQTQLLDDLCLRTFLTTAEESTYSFLHKSFQEFFAARYVFEHARRKDNAEMLEQIFQISLPHDIASYFKQMLRESPSHEKATIATNLIEIYHRNRHEDQTAITIRQQATYYASNLAIDTAARFLESIYQSEPNKWVQRGTLLGLALYFNRTDMLEQYLQIIRQDTQAATINTKYHLVYYGDQVGDLETLDVLEQVITRSEKTVTALFRHLQNEQYRNGWPIDLFTLSSLLRLQGLSILATHTWYLPFLKQFLETDHPDHGSILSEEKERLQQLIKGDHIIGQ